MMSRKWVFAILVMLGCANWMQAAVSVTTAIGSGADTYLSNDSKNKSTSKYGTSSMLELRRFDGTRSRVVYLRFDISSVDPAMLLGAYLTINNYGGAPRTLRWEVFGLKDGADDNWDEGTINYANAPGMMTPPQGNDKGYHAVDPVKAVRLGTWSVTAGTSPLTYISNVQELYLDGFIAKDTNNLVTFILAGQVTDTSADWYLSSKEKTADPAPKLTFDPNPAKAKNPIPSWNVTVPTSLTQLQWTAPEPNLPGGIITYDVYRGTTEPNYLAPDYDYTTIVTGTTETTATMPALDQFTTYYWIVDCHDTTLPGVVTGGDRWTFNTNNNAPTVNVGPDQYIWLSGDPGSVAAELAATVIDDGFPSGTLTYKWEQTAGTPVVIDPNTVQNTSVTLTVTGLYEFKLTVDDSEKFGYDTVLVSVSADPCSAAKAKPGYIPLPGDVDGDCYVGLEDFADMASNWLQCHSFMDAPCI